jgi:HEAT repeat protein
MGGSGQAALPDETAAKLHRIDIIDAEIIQEGKEPSQKDENVLKSLLKDANPDVKVRTIQVLLKYDMEEAFRQIESMTLSAQKEQRLSAIKLLGGIATNRSAEILISCLEDEEGDLKRQAMSALRSLLNENLDSAIQERIRNAISGISQNEGWIVH